MGTREKDQTTPHQPLLSSLVVRPSDSGGGGAGGGSDYEPGEVRRDPPPYSRSDRFSDNPALNVAWCKNLGLEEGMSVHAYTELTLVSWKFQYSASATGCASTEAGICMAEDTSLLKIVMLDFCLRATFGMFTCISSCKRLRLFPSEVDKLVGTSQLKFWDEICWILDVDTMDDGNSVFADLVEFVIGIFMGLVPLDIGIEFVQVLVLPVRRRNADHRYSPDFDHPGGHHRNRGYGSMRSPGRYRDYSPPYGRGRGGGGRFMNRGFDGPGFGPGAFRGEGMPRNNPNVRPREGDWICPDPLCNNLNFARREYCNNCNKSRYAPGGSPPPRRGYPGPPPPHGPPRRFPGPPLDRPSGRSMNGYRSSPRGWARDGPREFGAGGPPHPRYDGGRFTDHQMRRDRLDYPEEDYRERSKFDRPMPPLDWGNKDRGGRDNFFNERKGFERRPPSPPLPPPPLPPPRGRWAHDVRDRSRSPIRGGGPAPSKDYRRDMYMEQGRDERRGGMGRDRIGDAY
ncbi:hypothetical protein TEA_019377 [Camellia sinensis var. sinensis]|uniref:RanBP2-type domain-containing protein n=1 Tax=Camellia sinensis var. sinensis TaxID=542762 RepID=A0A4S4EF31_CAMSN|nr:hypothetical protein TEA_019377 [Camellia sinensis var. sinensis]